jgi:hypothetical protein
MGNEADKNNCQGLIMAQNSLVLNYKRVEYPPDFSIPATTYSEPDELLNLILNSKKPRPVFHGLIQIEFTLNGERILFPNFDNIFSRSESVRDWWFLSPEFKGKAIYQSDEEVSAWWEKFQGIYNSSILLKIDALAAQFIFLKLSNTNELVESLFLSLLAPPDRLSIVDEKDLIYPIVYCYNLFRDCEIKEYWRFWLWQKAIVHYYHVIFAPKLLEKFNDREILRLSNRFPEYARAVGELAALRESLYGKVHIQKKFVDKFFNIQSEELREEVLARKRKSGELSGVLCQCRVCGIIFPIIKIVGEGKGKGKLKQICSKQKCEKAWELLRKSLPQDPNHLGIDILISHL